MDWLMWTQFMNSNEELDKRHKVDSYSLLSRLPHEQPTHWIFIISLIPIHLWRFLAIMWQFTPIRRSGLNDKYHMCGCHPSNASTNLLGFLNDQWQIDTPLPNDNSRIIWVTNRSMSTIWRMKSVMKWYSLQVARNRCAGVVLYLWIQNVSSGVSWRQLEGTPCRCQSIPIRQPLQESLAICQDNSPWSQRNNQVWWIMDHGVMDSIRPVWMVRSATITQSSSSSLAVDSIVWNCSSSRSGFTNCDAS